ncbi:LysR family transcriptional regulator [Caldithrix abyssi]|nr:LysR family transcriptional regulator [Caldithrix abyssi]
MKLTHVKLIKILAEEGTLTKAGKRLYLSQPALSRQLKDLEDEYGVTLFRRIGKKMVLTEAGNRALSTASKILEELDGFEEDIKSYSGKGTGSIRLTLGCYTCYFWLPPLLKSFNKIYPNVDIQIITEATDDPIQFLNEGKLEIGIVSTETKSNILKFIPLFQDSIVVVIPKDHPWKNFSFIKPQDFAREHLIIYPRPITAVQKLLNSAGVIPEKVSKFQLTEARIEMVRAGLGVTVMANWAVKPYLKNGNICTVPLTRNGLQRTWYAALPKMKDQNDYTEAFVAHLREHFNKG